MEFSDAPKFSLVIAGLCAYHRQPCSDALIAMYWRGCKRWSYEQVVEAIDRLTQDAEMGKFIPKIGDIARILEGTHSDQSKLAWGKVHEAMSSVGAYSDVVFDDPATHAAVEDLGGWPKLCRTELKDLGYTQHRFCESHKAYAGRGEFAYPRRLSGERSPDSDYVKKGIPLPRPAIVGDISKARLVYSGGAQGGKTAITFQPIESLSMGFIKPLALESV